MKKTESECNSLLGYGSIYNNKSQFPLQIQHKIKTSSHWLVTDTQPNTPWGMRWYVCALCTGPVVACVPHTVVCVPHIEPPAYRHQSYEVRIYLRYEKKKWLGTWRKKAIISLNKPLFCIMIQFFTYEKAE